MLKKNIKIKFKNGFHIRPATKFVKEAKKFSSEIKIKLKDKIINAKSLLEIQTLGIIKGSIITLIIDGKDENNAIEVLSRLFNSLEE